MARFVIASNVQKFRWTNISKIVFFLTWRRRSQLYAYYCLFCLAIARKKKHEGQLAEAETYTHLVQELLIEDPRSYKEMMGINYNCFKKILQNLKPYISPSESFKMSRWTHHPLYSASGEKFNWSEISRY